jgi:hypothetical protein
MSPEGWGTYASVVVVMLAMIFFVNPSISFGLAFLATLDKDLVMILRPFLYISIRTKFTCDIRVEYASQEERTY